MSPFSSESYTFHEHAEWGVVFSPTSLDILIKFLRKSCVKTMQMSDLQFINNYVSESIFDIK